MGLKFKKFKAKLNWKTKETVPEVVCLRYHVHSEFDEALVPASSNTQLGTRDVIKQKKAPLKPPVQSMFETNVSIPNTFTPISSMPNPSRPKTSATNTSTPADKNVNNINEKTKTNSVLTSNQNTAAATSEPAPPKGILKKTALHQNAVGETKFIQNETADADDDKTSALIFMTENHDDNEETKKEKNDTKETKKELDLATNTVQGINKHNSKTTVIAHQEEETGEFRFSDNIKDKSEITELNFHTNKNEDKILLRNTSDSESEQGDVKTVRWRETIVEIKATNLEIAEQKPEESADDFTVHFVKYQNFSTTGLQPADAETEESESEDNDQPQVSSHYGNRGAYSSQAASIFFAGEEPEPTPRVRNVSQEQDDDVSGNIHSSV